jgi:hypothetical protein
MSCPGIDELLAGGAAAEHARGCDDCRAVLEVVAARAPAGCGLAEALMAAQATGEIAAESERLLALHLGNCASCAMVAGSLDAPAMADALASAVELERSFGDHSPAVDDQRVDRRARRRDRDPVRRRKGVAVAVIALLAIAVIAALVTRALG